MDDADARVAGRRSAGTTRLYGAEVAGLGHFMPRTSTLATAAAVVWLATLAGRQVPALAGTRLLVALFCVCAATVAPRARTVAWCLVAIGVAGGAGAWHGVSVPESASCTGRAVVRTDPRTRGGATNIVLEIEGVRWRVVARGRTGGMLARTAAGEVLDVEATCERGTGEWASRDRVRHIMGRAHVVQVAEVRGAGSALTRASNRVRRALVDGTTDVPESLRGLFTGLAVGDDRAQSQEMIDDFRATGISHLTAVSGQNVAYLLAMMSPILSRLGRWWRLGAVLALIGWFTVLTRAEPSVVRAGVMAGLVAISGAVGAGLNARTVLSSTVIVLLVVDPMLAWSVGFALSVGATAGLAWLSAPITQYLGARIPARSVIASTLAAQAGTSPVLLFVFGSIPVMTLVANPLVIGVAGVVMTIGVPLALVGALVPWTAPLVAAVLTPPLWWIAAVADVAAAIGPTGWVNAACWCGALVLCAGRVRNSRSARV